MKTAVELDSVSLQTELEEALEEVERRLKDSVVGARGLVDSLTGHLMAAGGKRMRPLMTLLCATLGSPAKRTSNEVLTAAVVVELTHLATLYHDDVMDSAPSRRGAPAAQRLWGNNRAILAGDVLFARASKRVAKLGPEAVAQHATCFERLCLGQLNETFGPEQGEDAVDFYIQVLADKTGSLVAQAARYGAELSGAGPEVAGYVAEYGEKVGVAFQIADDVLDLTSDPEMSGKTPGTDLREGVDTLPVLLLKKQRQEGNIDAAGQRILALLGEDLEDDANLNAVVQSVREHPVLEQTRDLARAWAGEAKAVLQALPDSPGRAALVEFADLLVDRLA
ncbi:MAG: polyprenyl synthetase family protein [Actinomycetaceae bacterium]|nr:polyprenyl synthetase family protein [Actinomycetaceae bacterium]